MKIKKMDILFFIIALIILTFLIGALVQHQRFQKEVKLLFSQSKDISNQRFSLDQLSGLPEPVQQYFKHVLKEDQPYISYVRLKHDGQFKPGFDNDWVAIQGEQYFTTQTPGFIWKGKTSIATAYDSYVSGKGSLRVVLLSLFKVVDAYGESFDQGELLRWLGESFWFPTNLLPSEKLKWSPIDANSAQLTFEHNNLSLNYTVNFNENHEVISVETKRYMEENRLETWFGEFSKYQEINGIIVPTLIKATWKLKEGDHNYVDFHLKEIEYDKPEMF